MSERTEIDYALTVSVEDAATELRKLERLLIRALGLLQRMGLPPEVDAAIEKLQRLIIIVRQAQITITLFYTTAGPIGWALAGISLVGTLMSAGEFMEDTLYDSQRGT